MLFGDVALCSMEEGKYSTRKAPFIFDAEVKLCKSEYEIVLCAEMPPSKIPVRREVLKKLKSIFEV
jgi:hypothetical protein